ncbi:hypothetical protein HY988_05775 [Candidatus Micrarchaeota archaeon]|nr:hypothetical protein [Candidatus Micrarchaeota archaeon]
MDIATLVTRAQGRGLLKANFTALSKVQIHRSFTYMIDPRALEEIKRRYNFEKQIPLIEIYNSFNRINQNHVTSELRKHCAEKEVPFSVALLNGIGACGELAIVTQIIGELMGKTLFLAQGHLYYGDQYYGLHAFNIELIGVGNWYLIDTMNPLSTRGQLSPFVFSIKEFDEMRERFVLDVPPGTPPIGPGLSLKPRSFLSF